MKGVIFCWFFSGSIRIMFKYDLYNCTYISRFWIDFGLVVTFWKGRRNILSS